MSEETTSPNPARRRSVPEESGGGKTLPIILVVLVLGLGFALFKRNRSAGVQAEKDALTISMLTSNVSELRTKLVLEQGNAGVAQTNHQAMLDRRTAALIMSSNRLVQTSLLLDRAREETRIAQAEIPAKAAALATLEMQRDESQRQAAVIPGLQREVAEMKEKLQQAQFAHAALQETLGRALVGQAELERKLEDPAFLRLQARRADEAAELRKRTAASQSIRVTDPRVRLDLQPDGTIRPAMPGGVAPKQ